MSYDDEAHEAARRIAVIKETMTNEVALDTQERRPGVTDVGPVDVDLDATVVSVRRGDNENRNIQIHLNCTGGYEAMCSFDIVRSAAPAIINAEIRTQVRVFAFTTWGIEPTISSRVVLFGAAS